MADVDDSPRVVKKKRLTMTRGRWSPTEDAKLKHLVSVHGEDAWHTIVKEFPHRSSTQCATRWNRCLSPNIIKGQWSPEDDDMLRHLVSHIGPKNWTEIASYLPGRIGKQCRERWHNHVDPTINKSPWTQEEDVLICQLYSELGTQWNKIAASLPGRTDNSVKNHFNSTLRRIYYDLSPGRARKNMNMSSHSGDDSSSTVTKKEIAKLPPLKIVSVRSLSASPQKPCKLTQNQSQFGTPTSSRSSSLNRPLPPMIPIVSPLNRQPPPLRPASSPLKRLLSPTKPGSSTLRRQMPTLKPGNSVVKRQFPLVKKELEEEDDGNSWKAGGTEPKVDPLYHPQHVDVKPYLKPLEGVLLATWICDTCNCEFSTYEALELHVSENECVQEEMEVNYEQDIRVRQPGLRSRTDH